MEGTIRGINCDYEYSCDTMDTVLLLWYAFKVKRFIFTIDRRMFWTRLGKKKKKNYDLLLVTITIYKDYIVFNLKLVYNTQVISI